MRKIFVAGIGTDVGKTVVSAVLAEALRADYFKPVQCGELQHSDSMKVKEWVANAQSVVHREIHCFRGFMSPHAAAEEEGVSIRLERITLPDTDNHLIIEAAGGLMVPLNDTQMVVDLIRHFEAETVLVSRNYLGSINHTLLSVELLKSRGLDITGIIFNGDTVPTSEDIILKYTGLRCLGRIAQEAEINKGVVSSYAAQFRGI